MKRKKFKYIIIVVIILVLTTAFKTTSEDQIITEEAIPIRNSEEIIGLNYSITIPNNIKNNKVIIPTKIIDSINHYKDIKSINSFKVIITINNNSKYKYKVTNIFISSNNTKVKQKIKYHNYNNKISFKLIKNILINQYENYHINIEIKK